MKSQLFLILSLAILVIIPATAQPSYEAPPPDLTVVEDASQRRQQYLQRVNEVITWRAGMVERGDAEAMDLSSISATLLLHQNLDPCSRRVIALMQEPGT